MLTLSCAHATLLCVKPQEAALAHTQQPASLLRAPFAMKKREKTQPKLLQHRKLHCCILQVRSSQQFSHNCYVALKYNSSFIWTLLSLLSYDKRELLSKMPPAVCSYLFLLTYFHQNKCSLITQGGQIEQHTRCCAHTEAVCTPLFRYLWSKEECRNHPDLLFLSEHFAKARREKLPLAWGDTPGILQVAVWLSGE